MGECEARDIWVGPLFLLLLITVFILVLLYNDCDECKCTEWINEDDKTMVTMIVKSMT